MTALPRYGGHRPVWTPGLASPTCDLIVVAAQLMSAPGTGQ